MKLKSIYPLYLNNEAVQPNTDLEVTDKYTGEVAFRTALATPRCDRGRDCGRGASGGADGAAGLAMRGRTC